MTSFDYNPKLIDKEDVRCGDPNSAFTRMTMFSMYIEEMKRYADSPERRCRSNRRCVRTVDGIVDCPEGENEERKKKNNRVNVEWNGGSSKFHKILLSF